MAENSSDENAAGIGFKPRGAAAAAPLRGGVTLINSSKKGAAPGGIGARFAAAKPALAARVVEVKSAPSARVVEVKSAVPKGLDLATLTAAAAAPTPKPAAAVAEGEEAAAEAAPEEAAAALTITEVIAGAEVDTGAAAAPVSVELAAALKKRLKDVDVRGIVPPPADAPTITREKFGTAIIPLQTKFRTEVPVEVTPAERVEIKAGKDVLASGPVYTPITSPEFPYFMVQTYRQYSKALSSAVTGAGGKLTLGAPKELDKEACKKFDPNKVENFYYQKLMRDYLSFGTPYRGSLLYHGLGSGKTCTSIAAAEALYWGGQKKIYIMTPATLSNNYRRELAKCGYFPLRRANFWEFLPYAPAAPGAVTRESVFLKEMLGLPQELINAQKGGWVPNPDKPSNWETLTAEQQNSIKEQQRVHLNTRFRFIHYNGVSPANLAQLAEVGLKEGASEFDNAVVIIDEVHNLVRTINGTQIGKRSISEIIEKGLEPREFTWTMPMRRARPGLKYPRGYTLYRLLQNAVNAKIICLSATPMINYAQELAVLINILGGEQRVVQIALKDLRSELTADERAAIAKENEAATKRAAEIAAAEKRAPAPPAMLPPTIMGVLELWAKYHPEIDFYAIEEAEDKSAVLRLTTVPHGFVKVAASDYPMRGFVRMKIGLIPSVSKSRERNMDLWGASLVQEMDSKGLFRRAGVGAEAITAVQTARAAGIGTPLTTPLFQCRTYPMLPEDAELFVSNFVDRATLKLLNRNVLIARCSGLASYYKGGSEELMPRMSRNEVVEVPMSDYMFAEYAAARMKEMEMEGSVPEAEGAAAGAATKGRKGMTMAEQDLYSQATKAPSAGFKTLTRAACNWVFPDDVPRPSFTAAEQAKVLGLDKKQEVLAADLAEETDIEQAPAASTLAVEGAAAGGEAILADEAVPLVEPALDTTLAGRVTSLLDGLEAKADPYLNTEIATFSPKYAAIQANIRTSPGPVLVYSQFKTLEGLGIFAAALRASAEKYIPLDIVQGAGGEWEIPEALMEAGRARYILYTGDQALEKRRILLQIYNADVASLPPRLSAQCAALLGDATDNRDGRVARVFMITQSGAEGISLFNTRQVHIMEPYWNNVRLQQVIGRAIRTCSHMNLPWEEREVSVFTYLSVFTAKQKAEGSRQVMMADKGMTTDQVIFDIATKKQKLADELSAVLQEAAIDCNIHYYENDIAGECFRFGKGSRPNFLWHPDWKRDLQLASMLRTAPTGGAGAASGGAGAR